MAEKTWGGKRKGAGRPVTVLVKRKQRSIYFFDEEFDLIKENAEKRNMGIHQYLYWLAENDKP